MPRIVVWFLATALLSCSSEVSSPPVAAVSLAPLSADASPAEVNAHFRQWLAHFLAASPEKRAELERTGLELASRRHLAMARLIAADPRLALELALTPPERAALPASIAQHVERWRDGRGALHVIGGQTDEGAAPNETWVTFEDDATPLHASLFGSRLTELSRRHLRLHGVVLDGAIALSESRLRRLFPGEERPLDLPLEFPRPCPVSKKKAAPDLVFHGGDELLAFCVPEHAEAHDRTLAEGETADAELNGEPPASAWTEGPKTVLFIRVDFSDQAGDPISQSSAQTLINSTVNQFFVENSFNKTSLTTTVTPTLRLPHPRSVYAADAGSYLGLRQEALSLAADAGFPPSMFTNDIVAFAGVYGGWSGRGYVGSRGTWLNGSFSLRTTAHELGHNYGSQHASYWTTSPLSPIAPNGTSNDYGNPFDVMGGGNSLANHFTAWVKSRFNWILPMAAPTAMTNGTYRVFALEPTVATGNQGLRVVRNASRAYWLEYRPAINTAMMRDGLSLNWDGPLGKSHLLDMTPGDGNRNNSALLIGSTFSDPIADLHFTPIAKAGTTPEAIDVVINRGPFPGNRAPTVSLTASATTAPVNQSVTFTATASDPDGDTLAYAWDFDDATWGPNAPMASKSFGTARAYNVRLTVSDMKGQTASTSVLVTVGTPTTFTLSGTATVSGQPVANVRVTDGTRSTFTTTDGTWRLTNVPAGSYTLTASKVDLTFTRSFAAPLTVAGDASGLDFTGATVPGYSISGTVTAGGMPAPGVVVSDGSRTATTNASGNYTLSGVPSGGYTLTATQPGYQYNPSFTNPVEVFGANVTGQNFVAGGFFVSGSIPAQNVATAPVVSDGIRNTTATRNGNNWNFTLQNVPNGSWNLTATSPGVTLTPGNFTNPITISNAGRSGLQFSVAQTATFRVSGTVRTGGTPLPGVVVSDGTRSGTTDSLGRYVIVGVPAGTYTLTPTLSGNTFVPATLMATVSTADLTGQDFNTSVVNMPPTVVTPAAATPSPVTGTTTALSVLGADDTGEPQLSYTWTATGAYPVNFSASGTNGAKATTATFTGGGSYVVTCTIQDPGGLSVQSTVMVQVQQQLTGLSVSPASANVMTGATQNFTAQGTDQFGRTMFAGATSWSVSGGGTIAGTSTLGTFTAGATPGGPHTVTAVSSGRTAMATLTVTGTGSPVITTAARATPNPVTATTTQLMVRANDDTGEPGLVYRWSLTQGPPGVTFSANDDNAAKDTVATFTQAGSYDFLVSVVDGAGNVATSAVTVVVNATITRVDVQPAVALLQPNGTQAFSAEALDQFDEPIVPAPTFTWSVSGGGTVDTDGLFTAGATEGGPFSLTATTGGQSDVAQITIAAEPDTTPPTVSITAPANLTQLTGPTAVTADATDDVAVVSVEFFVGTTSLGVVMTPPYTAMVDPGTLSNGAHQLTARARDAAGNVGTSAAVTVTVGNDVTPPVVSVVSPSDGATTGLLVPLSAVASDDIAVVGVDFEVDGVIVASLTQEPWMRDVTVSEGAHAVVAVARDGSGKSTRSASVAFTAVVAVSADGGVEADGGATFVEPEPVTASCGCVAVDPLACGALGVLLLARRRRAARGERSEP